MNMGQHRADCPQNEVANNDLRSCLVQDLHKHFGYLPNDLSDVDFKECFHDVAAGGTGTLEKLSVVGQRCLEQVGEDTFSQEFSCSEADQEHAPILRWVYVYRRKRRLIASATVESFARQEMACARGASSQLRVRLFYACLAFACQCRNTSLLSVWVPQLVQKMIECRKRDTAPDKPSWHSGLLEDLQDNLGYKQGVLYLSCEVQMCLQPHSSFVEEHAVLGNRLIYDHARSYFSRLALEQATPGQKLEALVDARVDTMLRTASLAFFAARYISLPDVLVAAHGDARRLAPLDYAQVFLALVAVCAGLSTTAEVNQWMPRLVRTMREVQVAVDLHAYSHSSRQTGLETISGTAFEKLHTYLTSLKDPSFVVPSERWRSFGHLLLQTGGQADGLRALDLSGSQEGDCISDDPFPFQPGDGQALPPNGEQDDDPAIPDEASSSREKLWMSFGVGDSRQVQDSGLSDHLPNATLPNPGARGGAVTPSLSPGYAITGSHPLPRRKPEASLGGIFSDALSAVAEETKMPTLRTKVMQPGRKFFTTPSIEMLHDSEVPSSPRSVEGQDEMPDKFDGVVAGDMRFYAPPQQASHAPSWMLGPPAPSMTTPVGLGPGSSFGSLAKPGFMGAGSNVGVMGQGSRHGNGSSALASTYLQPPVPVQAAPPLLWQPQPFNLPPLGLR
eukprot:gnl/MRDRNA2_/MRDRNA2_29509_c0_seq1.p1 gnl/MRDRNA2_/MRDRNA2_29509_c0~~gnl/MRDRNA2_/MRDRNA2_29509_c0_seq1.p1  ORF type:complete len:675 (+),score=112.81 gnl/MRDRNA2_/MRDRNA2_29509_c0_seq1:44-2068(+)